MPTIRAPFNFVPLNDKVYFPKWANQISHDIPFSDGESGVIELTITAHSPIFVRNGHTKDDAKNNTEEYKSFNKVGNQYFIPATSVKGAIRNVLEIISFGKMTQVENDTFGLRDLNNASYRDKMKKIHCGWLRKQGDEILLKDCGEPMRLSIKEIDRLLKTDLYSFISNSANFGQGKGRDAVLKYENIFTSRTPNRKTDKDFRDKFLSSREYLIEGTFDGKTGIIVLTGQPGVREYKRDRKNPITKQQGMWVGKEKEFIFPYTENRPVEVPLTVFKSFKSIHKNTPDFKDFWEIKLLRGEEIPVFFQYKENSDNIHSIGLSYLYKYPFDKSVYDGIPKELKNDKTDKSKIDLCEVLLGYSDESFLKGRVQFGHAMGIYNIIPNKKETISVSSSPHASYYPLYLGRNEDDVSQNWDNLTKIAGRKRYPVRNKILNNIGTDNMGAPMYLLNEKAVFSSQIRFHNLRPIEIGALLSALTFHANENCFHSIGYGKPMGYGKVKIKAELKSPSRMKKEEYLKKFEQTMNDFLEGRNWIDTPQITELIEMAKGIPEDKEEIFSYMKMSTIPRDNEFKINKEQYNNGKDYLRHYTDILIDTPIRKTVSKPTIESLEDKAGFYLEEGKKYRCNLNTNNMVSILSPDRDNRNRIDCPFVICDSSPLQAYNHKDYAEIKIIEVFKDDIDIEILKIFPPRQ